MRLRVKSLADVSTVLRIEVPQDYTLGDLEARLRNELPTLQHSSHIKLSMNKRDVMSGETAASLNSLGVCSGDTLWIMSATAVMHSLEATQARVQSITSSARPVPPACGSSEVNTSGLTSTSQIPFVDLPAAAHAMEVGGEGGEVGAESGAAGEDDLDIDDDAGASEILEGPPVPDFLQRVLAACASPSGCHPAHHLLLAAVHAVMLEAGFKPQRVSTAGEQQAATSIYYVGTGEGMLRYTWGTLTGPVASIRPLPMGPYLLLHTAVQQPPHTSSSSSSSTTTSSKRVGTVTLSTNHHISQQQAPSSQAATSTSHHSSQHRAPSGSLSDTSTSAAGGGASSGGTASTSVPTTSTAACAAAAAAAGDGSTGAPAVTPPSPSLPPPPHPGAASGYLQLQELWRDLKDGVALPLLAALHFAAGLPPPVGLTVLPMEIKLDVLGRLQARDLAAVAAVCTELRHLSSVDPLWQPLFTRDFPTASAIDIQQAQSRGWKAAYHRHHQRRSARQRRRVNLISPLSYPRPSSGVPGSFRPPFMIGGDYDRFPMPALGIGPGVFPGRTIGGLNDLMPGGGGPRFPGQRGARGRDFRLY